ncbi:MFS transporter [Lysinibacillus sp. NPDC056185]|uniref:MFS transporter n=1 Tax=Lysinibacillus sp. NPDC056185 TaxID=3345739 RepID=UPI0039EF8768
MNQKNVYKRRWWALSVLIIGLLVIGFDTTILTVALPVFVKELDASTTDLQWIMNIYILFLAAFLLSAGSIGDKYGRKKVLLIGLILFGITSIMAGMSDSTEMLIVARALMGIAAAIMLPLTMSIVPTIFPNNERGKAISIWAAGMGVGLLIGPLVGGFLLEHYAWESIFFVNLPIIAVTLVGVIFLVPESKDTASPKLDWSGMILSGLGLMLIVYGITEGPEKGWLSWETLLSIIIGLILLIFFVMYQRTIKHPMLDLSLFKNKRFTWATVAGCVVMFVLSGLLFFVTQYMVFFFNLTPLETGVRLMPFIGAYVVGTLISNGITSKIGTKWIIVAGLFVTAVGLYIMSMLNGDSTYSNLVVSFIVIGFGMGLMLAPAMDAVMESMPLQEVGIGSAVNNALRQVGGTLGIALMGSVITYNYERDLANSLNQMPNSLLKHAQQSIGAAKQIALKLEMPMKEQLLTHAGNAFLDGMKIALIIGIIVTIVGIITTILFLPSFKEKK